MSSVDELILTRRERWASLQVLLDRAGSDPRRLEAAEIERLSGLYRQVVADLALARRDFPDDQVVAYLNGLAARAYPLVYRAPVGSWRQVWQFFLVDFPRRYLETGPFIFVAFLLVALPALAGYLVVLQNPPLAEQILPPEMTRVVRDGRLWTEIPGILRPMAASRIATNNIQVSILAFGGGILLGTLTVYALVLNGLNLGAVFGYTHLYGLDGQLAAFVSSHGYIELTVIFIAGGAGLRIAWAIVEPGLLRRRDALIQSGREATLLVIGALPLLLVAGLIEGLVSPSGLPDVWKLLLGPTLGVCLHLFLLSPLIRARRKPHPPGCLPWGPCIPMECLPWGPCIPMAPSPLRSRGGATDPSPLSTAVGRGWGRGLHA